MQRCDVMKNKEYIAKLAEEAGIPVDEAQKNLVALIEVISSILQESNSVAIAGFGTFEVKKKNERVSVNPVTKKRLLIPPKLVVNFKPSSSVKEKLKEGNDHE